MIVSLSILSAPLLDLASAIERMIDCGVDRLHLDIMDGHYVDRIAFGIDWVYEIKKKYPHLLIDVHFMVYSLSQVSYDNCISAGASRVWLHPDVIISDSLRALNKNWVCALTDSPESMPRDTENCLIMSVKPGAGGQSFCQQAFLQIMILKQRKKVPWIAVDGGVTELQLQQLKNAKVDEVILGSSIFRSHNPENLVKLAKS